MMRGAPDTHSPWRPTVKAPLSNSRCNHTLHAVRNALVRPDWRPALLMVTSGLVGLLPAVGHADTTDFHHAPASPSSRENPRRGSAASAQAGAALYATHCAACHGASAEGSGNIPALAHARVQSVPDGEVFWFI